MDDRVICRVGVQGEVERKGLSGLGWVHAWLAEVGAKAISPAWAKEGLTNLSV
jgi:hypothetical protein